MFAARTGWDLTPNRFSQALRLAQRTGKQLLDLTVSNPTESGLEYDQHGIVALLSDPKVLTYEPQPKGLLTARRAVQDYYRSLGHSVDVDPESIFITVSTSE